MGFIEKIEADLLHVRARRDVQEIVLGFRIESLSPGPIEERAVDLSEIPGIL